MKKNRAILSLLEPEELACFKEVGGENLIYSGSGREWTANNRAITGDGVVYRIRPDYQPPKPEPKIVKCEIVRDVYYGHDRLVGVYSNATMPVVLIMVVPAFSHFEKYNGDKIGIENIATEMRNGGKVFACFMEE
jgi:hypothetical protein